MRRALSIVAPAIVLACVTSGCQKERRTDANRPADNATAQATPANTPRDEATRPAGNVAPPARVEHMPPARVENTPHATALSEDEHERHRLFQAAATTRDRSIIRQTGRRLGLFNQRNEPTADYRPFVEKHLAWARADAAFVRDMNTPQKARAYLNEHK